MKPYYEDATTTIYHGDCRELLPTLVGAGVDLILTDPPYNRGKDYGGHDDSMPRSAYQDWCSEWFAEARQVSRRLVVFPGHGNVDIWYNVSARPTAIGCWYKPGNHASSVIGFEEWEPWLYWHGGDKGLLGGSSVIRETVGEQHDTGDHPCPKPVGLMTRLLIKCRSDFVVDPFMGSGSTPLAAKNLGKRSIGIELNERYCEIAARRLSQEILPFTEEAS